MKIKIPRKQKKRIKNSHPLILVCYINVGKIPKGDVEKHLSKIASLWENSAHNFVNYFIPVRGQETKIECINPVQINNKMYAKIVEQLGEYKNKLNDFLAESKGDF